MTDYNITFLPIAVLLAMLAWASRLPLTVSNFAVSDYSILMRVFEILVGSVFVNVHPMFFQSPWMTGSEKHFEWEKALVLQFGHVLP